MKEKLSSLKKINSQGINRANEAFIKTIVKKKKDE